MSNLDTFYRAFVDYRKNTADDRDCTLQRNAIARAGVQNDTVEVKRCVCTIEEDWVEAIEAGLVFIEKAIGEERQFIRNNGEILPIEKVKRVSRDSVEHLSRHSNLIRKKPEEGQDIVPEQLYTVERLSDYALYENRFLYMLLKYLEQFIALRYNRIVELTNTYHGKLALDKQVSTRGTNMSIKLELSEERRNDPLLEATNPNREVIERIEMLMRSVAHFLATPLMQEVAKTPMLKPPITKTNVLKMNNNFRGAMKLYEFVMAYAKDGYTVQEQIKRLAPFSDITGDELAEVTSLASFLTYAHGMGMREKLKENYLKEEEVRKAKEDKRKQEQLKSMRRRIDESGEGVEEYMLALEKRNRELELLSGKLEQANEEIEKRDGEIESLSANIESLKNDVSEAGNKISELENKYTADMAGLKSAHAEEIKTQEERHRSEMTAKDDEIKAEERKREEAVAEVERKFDELKEAYAEERAELEEEHEKEQAEKDAKIADIKEENRLLGELKSLSDGRLNALRSKYGLMTPADDFTTEEAFNEIELQYHAFRSFFKGEWKKTKKRIRREAFGKKPSEADNRKEPPQTPPEAVETEAAEVETAEQTDTETEE